ncbi:uncharacterized protein J8A68_000750 [[Candida] subhashii]|uniref:Uncharacterized protein n=1 Tax=[Candida] subhashii TaxID=561895 RepID=A0A8J5QUW7_9ASCO|nr:uncharacterized protein J8A68_000750 [[Candida] subhashii]KAG7665730.1 hypothetical protein J8A68_000750 [[Candida] subhashii]
MFRFVSSNTQNGLKTAVLSKAKLTKTTLAQLPPGLCLQPASQTTSLSASNSVQNLQFIRNKNFSRHNDGPRYEDNRGTPTRVWLEDKDFQEKSRYIDLKMAIRKADDLRMDELAELKAIMGKLPKWAAALDYIDYLRTLQNMSIKCRKIRLNGKDRVEGKTAQFENEVTIQNLILDVNEMILEGKLDHILSDQLIYNTMTALMHYELNQEVLAMWEKGINHSTLGELYMSPIVLAAVIPHAFAFKRFTYEEIAEIYDLVTKDVPTVPALCSSMGFLALQNGDYGRAMDIFELLVDDLSKAGKSSGQHRAAISRIHCGFIGECTDIAISRSFFEKLVYDSESLPYVVQLKVPQVNSFLKNCAEQGLPFEEITSYYNDAYKYILSGWGDLGVGFFNNLHVHFFGSFFKQYPEATEQARDKLWEILANHASMSNIILNIVISQCPWNDPKYVRELLDSFEYLNIKKNLASYRTIFKKLGDIPCSNQEIIEKWNELLKQLDDSKFKSIPGQDWSLLRQPTVLSNFQAERCNLYLEIVKTYKDYMGNEEACTKFLKTWRATQPSVYDLVSRITTEKDPYFGFGKIEIPQFRNLKPSVNYRKATLSYVTQHPAGSKVDDLPIVPVSFPSAFASTVGTVAKELDNISKEIESLSGIILGNGSMNAISKEVERVENEVESISKEIKALQANSVTKRGINLIAQEVEAVVNEVEAISKEIKASHGKRNVNDISQDIEGVTKALGAISLEIAQIMNK